MSEEKQTPGIDALWLAVEQATKDALRMFGYEYDEAETRGRFDRSIAKIQQDARDHEASYWRRTCRALENAVAAAHRREAKANAQRDQLIARNHDLEQTLRELHPSRYQKLGVQYALSDLEKTKVPNAMGYVRDLLTHQIAEALVDSDLIEITEHEDKHSALLEPVTIVRASMTALAPRPEKEKN